MRSNSSAMRPGRAARRRRGGIASLALGSLVLSALVGLTVAPASAATRIPLTVVGGDRQISAAWTAVPGAKGYVVHWGTGRSTSRRVSTTGTSIRLTSVKNLTRYSVQVTATGVSASSSRVGGRTEPWVPTPISSVRAAPAGPNQIRVSWSGGSRARDVAVIAGADSMTTTHRFSTGWMPAAVHSALLTVPASLRGVLGAGTGNVVFVKVALSDSTKHNPTKHLRFDLRDKYRLTDSGTWTLAGNQRTADSTTRVSVASWNVQSITASAEFSTLNQWSNRLPRVAANIEAQHPDLIGLQELTTARIKPNCLNSGGSYSCVEQYQTLATALGDAAVPYRMARTDGNAWVYSNPGYVDSALMYNPNKLRMLDSGFISPVALMGSAWPSRLTNEAGMWAQFAILDASGAPGRTFYAASIHLPAGDNGSVRAAEGAAVARFMDAKAQQPDGTSVPVVIVGDFNAFGAWDSASASLKLLAAHYVDAAATTDRTNLRYSTSNATNGSDGADPGYPRHAVAHPYPTSRIDYIMVKNSPSVFSYRNVVPTTSGNVMDSRYQGSDHNMQLATIGIGDPIAAQ
jgi:endonuclease/exonuclease/phosphatase family metal-dependent hydrolase